MLGTELGAGRAGFASGEGAVVEYDAAATGAVAVPSCACGAAAEEGTLLSPPAAAAPDAGVPFRGDGCPDRPDRSVPALACFEEVPPGDAGSCLRRVGFAGAAGFTDIQN